VNAKDTRILRRCKRKIGKRLARREWTDQPKPMFAAGNIHYEMAERTRAISCGGIGAFHRLAQQTGLVKAINRSVSVLKRHLPYFESDHVLNVAFNTLVGGTCLDDIELRRNDEAYLDALDAERIPDPTTEGDFARRFSEEDVVALMEGVNEIRVRMWKKRLSREERREAILDVDGTLAPTAGECKEGMGLSYNGVWSYHPLLVSLANTMEPMYLCNRPGNKPSHEGAVEWMDRAAGWARQAFDRVTFRGDTGFCLTANFDRWTADGIGFAFSFDAMKNLIGIAESLEKTGAFEPLTRPLKHQRQGPARRRKDRVKERIVVENEYKNIRLASEEVAEVQYQPVKCRNAYRLIILKKNLSVEKGENVLFADLRYFFYITNLEEMSTEEVVFFCNERCNQENLIEQLKNGLNALRMPVGDLVSNGAYMVMASLAWTLKAWWALLVRDGERREAMLNMEFRRFRQAVVDIPAQIVRTGRRIVYRLLGYNDWIRTFLQTFDRIGQLRLT
jgi:hypothetical protein